MEEKMKKNVIFPKIWLRYVDDVIAIVKRDKIDQVLHLINGI